MSARNLKLRKQVVLGEKHEILQREKGNVMKTG